jgi:hypothetical protein
MNSSAQRYRPVDLLAVRAHGMADAEDECEKGAPARND